MTFLIKPATVLLFIFLTSFNTLAIEITRLTVEMLENPLCIDVKNPRLGWQLDSELRGDKQTAYQVLVASTVEELNNDSGAIWNSKKVKSGQSQLVVFDGSSLESGKTYYWKVRVWDMKGGMSEWSDTGSWKMAPDFSKNDILWIGAISREDSNLPEGRNFHSPELRKKEKADLWNNVNSLAKRSIMLRKPIAMQKEISDAVVYISGLGHYVLTINGKRIGNSEFAPLWSYYDKTVYYNTYRLDQNVLSKGSNAIGVLLGNGMYNVSGDRYRKLLVSFGPPTLFFRMDVRFTDGSQTTITSDNTWKYAESPVTFNCIYGGEDYDATLEQDGWDKPGFDDSNWKAVVMQDAPKGMLRAQLAAPVKTMKTYPVKSVAEPQSGVYVFDMGQNLSGYPSIKVQGKRGQVVKLIVGESLSDKELVSQGRTGSPYYLQYTLKGNGVEEWHPAFTYYGFQFIQVEGADYKTASSHEDHPILLDINSHFIYNSSGDAGDFQCSNELFNKVHTLINNAVKSNWQSVFTDCPHREKLGWLEETHLNGPGLLYNYNLAQYIPKVMRDIADAQRPDGLIPSIAPEYVIFGGDFSDSPEWGIAGVILPWMYYEFYGDRSLIEQYYPVMKKYVDYLSTTATDYIVSHGLGDWYDYGDHPAGYSKNSPIALSATAHYYYGATLVMKAADLLGKSDDALTYQTLSEHIREAHNNKFFNSETKQYATGSQYSNAVSLFLELVDPANYQAVLDNLVRDVKEHGYRLTTGDVGNRYLYQALARNDKNDVMYAMHNHYDAPGYGFQVKFGLTTLTEQWDPRKGNSWNHFMMGQIEEWFYRTLAGIVPDPVVPGFKHCIIKPIPVGDLSYVRATHESLYGMVEVNWKKDDNKFTLSVNVPVNTTATVILPVPDDWEILMDGKEIKNTKAIQRVKKSPVFNVGSGSYVFECHAKKN